MLFKHNISPTAVYPEIDSSHLSMGLAFQLSQELSLLLFLSTYFPLLLICLLNMSFPFVFLLNITLYSNTLIGTCLKRQSKEKDRMDNSTALTVDLGHFV